MFGRALEVAILWTTFLGCDKGYTQSRPCMDDSALVDFFKILPTFHLEARLWTSLRGPSKDELGLLGR